MLIDKRLQHLARRFIIWILDVVKETRTNPVHRPQQRREITLPAVVLPHKQRHRAQLNLRLSESAKVFDPNGEVRRRADRHLVLLWLGAD